MKIQYKLIEMPIRAAFDRSSCDFLIKKKCLFVFKMINEKDYMEGAVKKNKKTKVFKYIPLLNLKSMRF